MAVNGIKTAQIVNKIYHLKFSDMRECNRHIYYNNNMPLDTILFIKGKISSRKASKCIPHFESYLILKISTES